MKGSDVVELGLKCISDRLRETGETIYTRHELFHLLVIGVLIHGAIGPQEIRNVQIEVLRWGSTSGRTDINTRPNRAGNDVQRSPRGSFGVVPVIRDHHTYFDLSGSTGRFGDKGAKGQFET